jgi:hypothetical protein
MVDIVILVCAATVGAADCNPHTATHVLRAPVAATGTGGCMMQGMVHAAQSNTVDEGYYPKIVCVRDAPVTHARRE